MIKETDTIVTDVINNKFLVSSPHSHKKVKHGILHYIVLTNEITSLAFEIITISSSELLDYTWIFLVNDTSVPL